MAAFLQRPRTASTRHYNLAEFGLDAAGLRERFARYVRHFALAEEASGS
jgi:hypothetical protein